MIPLRRTFMPCRQTMLLSPSEPLRPLHQISYELTNEVLRYLVGQIPRLIKARSSICNHHLRLVDGEHVQRHHDLTQMILRARRADETNRSAHDRRRFAVPRAVSVRPRSPINRVLQHAGNRVVVLRRGEEDGVRLAQATLKIRKHPKFAPPDSCCTLLNWLIARVDFPATYICSSVQPKTAHHARPFSTSPER